MLQEYFVIGPHGPFLIKGSGEAQTFAMMGYLIFRAFVVRDEAQS